MEPSSSQDNLPAQNVGTPHIPSDNQPASPPAPPAQTPGPTPMQQQVAAGNAVKVAEHAMTEMETMLFNQIYASYENLQKVMAGYMCEKHGYPQKEPVAFEFNWQNKTVSAFRPGASSKIEVASDAPSAPAQGQTP